MANTTFFSDSINQKKTLLQKLHSNSPEDSTQFQNLIDQVLNHYILYYQEKSIAARKDPFLFLHPPWLSSFEKSILWLGEFKPSLIFTLIDRSVKDLTAEQGERIERLRGAKRREERDLTEAVAEIQERVAAPPICGLVRRSYRSVDGEVSRMGEAVGALKEEMLAVLERADALRISTVANVAEILSPGQGVRFFAAAIELQLRLREWGQLRDLSNGNGVA